MTETWRIYQYRDKFPSPNGFPYWSLITGNVQLLIWSFPNKPLFTNEFFVQSVQYHDNRVNTCKLYVSRFTSMHLAFVLFLTNKKASSFLHGKYIVILTNDHNTGCRFPNFRGITDSTHESINFTACNAISGCNRQLFPLCSCYVTLPKIKERKDNLQEMTDLESFDKYLDYLFSFIFRQRRHLSQCIRSQTKLCKEKVKAIIGCE